MSLIIDPVFPSIIPVAISTGAVISVFSGVRVSIVSSVSISFCGRKISSDIQSSLVFTKRSRFSHPRMLTIGSSGYTYSGTDSPTEKSLIRDNDVFTKLAHSIGLPRLRVPDTTVREPE